MPRAAQERSLNFRIAMVRLESYPNGVLSEPVAHPNLNLRRTGPACDVRAAGKTGGGSDASEPARGREAHPRDAAQAALAIPRPKFSNADARAQGKQDRALAELAVDANLLFPGLR
jgi:hypothetical protein